MKNVAVNGFSYSISDSTVVCTIVLTGVSSTYSFVDNNGICLDGFSLTVTAITVPSKGATISDPGPYNASFSSSSSNTTDNNTKVLLVNDKTGTITATPQIPSGGTPVPYPVTFYISISNAGQSTTSSD
jgi:hypothetical protein